MTKEYLFHLATDQIHGVIPTTIKLCLLLLSWVYGFALKVLLLCYQLKIFSRYSLPKPVVSIGNMTLGGSGKTPFIEWLAKGLKEKQAKKPVVLIRGYMERGDSRENSDEANLLRESLENIPVVVGRDRVKKAKEAMGKYPADIFLLDDGFQHWRLKRDLDIVLINASNPFGNGQLIPRGILREPLSSLKRAGAIVLTKTDLGRENLQSLKERLRRINPSCLLAEAVHRPAGFVDIRRNQIFDMAFLKGKTICSLCSIGDPKSFEYSLKTLGADIKKSFIFMDHHVYTVEDIKAVVDFCAQNDVKILVTTQKDAVKLRSFLNRFNEALSLLSLKIKLDIVSGKDEIESRVSHLFDR